MISFNLSYVLKGPVFNYSHIGGKSFQHMNSEVGDTIWSIHYTLYTLKMVPDVSHLTLQILSLLLSTCSMLRDTDLCVVFGLSGPLASDRAWPVGYTSKK